MSEHLNGLLEMGFSKMKAERALKATGNAGVVEAMDWLIAHEDDGEMADNESENGDAVKIIHEKVRESATSTCVKPKSSCPEVENGHSSAKSEESTAVAEAHSYKCEDCDKKFRNVQEMEFHAAKSGHANFSESGEALKGLTAEERQAKAIELQLKIKQKRELREAEDKKQTVEAEKLRRKQGQDIQMSRQQIQEAEMKKLVEERKREKIEDQLAKKRVLEQIQRDREARKATSAGEDVKVAEPPKPTTVAPPVVEGQKCDHCRIQIRLLDGKTLSHTFGAKEPLSAVRLFIELNRTDGSQPFDLAQNFPKRVFGAEQMEASLETQGLVPATSLFLLRKPAVPE